MKGLTRENALKIALNGFDQRRRVCARDRTAEEFSVWGLFQSCLHCKSNRFSEAPFRTRNKLGYKWTGTLEVRKVGTDQAVPISGGQIRLSQFLDQFLERCGQGSTRSRTKSIFIAAAIRVRILLIGIEMMTHFSADWRTILIRAACTPIEPSTMRRGGRFDKTAHTARDVG